MASATEIVAGIMAIIITLAYIGGVVLLAYMAPFSPIYQTEFNQLLNWSVVPGLIWGFYFDRATAMAMIRRMGERKK